MRANHEVTAALLAILCYNLDSIQVYTAHAVMPFQMLDTGFANRVQKVALISLSLSSNHNGNNK